MSIIQPILDQIGTSVAQNAWTVQGNNLAPTELRLLLLVSSWESCLCQPLCVPRSSDIQDQEGVLAPACCPGLSNSNKVLLSQFPYATVTTVTLEHHHKILLVLPVILSLHTTQSAHMCPWTYVDTLESRACPHLHMVTHEDTQVRLCTHAYCLAPYCLSPFPLHCSALTAFTHRFPVTWHLGLLPNGTNLCALH
jgi:hypothetical protein